MRNARCNGQLSDGTRCGNVGTVKIALKNRGGRNAYFCAHCAQRLGSYFEENNTRYGKVKMNAFTFSLELETHGYANGYDGASLTGRMELAEKGFVPTSDSTVDIEFKSPIWEGLNAPSKFMVSLEALMAEGEVSIDSKCGSHFHVGHREYINAETIDYMRRFCHSLFVPLSDELLAHPAETKRMFGRSFPTRWAQPITADTYATKHENFINLQHDWTVEFRLCKFVNAEQYQNLMRFCKDVTNTLIKGFIMKFNEEPRDTRRYANKTEYRKHNAEKTAQKLVKLYRKYAGLE